MAAYHLRRVALHGIAERRFSLLDYAGRWQRVYYCTWRRENEAEMHAKRELKDMTPEERSAIEARYGCAVKGE